MKRHDRTGNKISCRHLFGVIIVYAVLFQPGSATAARWGEVFPELTAQDIEIIKKKARVEMNGKPEGTVLEWDNSKSGNSGNVTLLKRFSAEGRECRALRHVFNVVRAAPYRYKVTICLQPDGTWKWRTPPR
jgi:surface antigen